MDLQEARRILSQLAKEDSQTTREKHFRTAGVISEYVREKIGVSLTVVGGLSVEIYTDGGYMTNDIDFVGENHEGIMECLADLGYVTLKDAGLNVLGGEVMRIHPELNSLVEVPANRLKGADEERVQRLLTPDGLEIHVIGIEDILADRIRASVHYKETVHYEYIQQMLEKHYERIDFSYLYQVLNKTEAEFLDTFLALIEQEEEAPQKLEKIRQELISTRHRDSEYGRIHSNLENLIIFKVANNDYIGFTTYPDLNIYRYDEEQELFVLLDEERLSLPLIDVLEWFGDKENTNGYDFSGFCTLVEEVISK